MGSFLLNFVRGTSATHLSPRSARRQVNLRREIRPHPGREFPAWRPAGAACPCHVGWAFLLPHEATILQAMIKYIIPVGDWLGDNVPKAGLISVGVIAAVMGDSPIYPGRDIPDSSVPIMLSGDYYDGRTFAFSSTAAAEMIEAGQPTLKD